jgi:hypothetical protein
MKNLRKFLCVISAALLFSASAQAGQQISYIYFDSAGNPVGGVDIVDNCGEFDHNGNPQTGYSNTSSWGVTTNNYITYTSWC